jgi:hypothetical protein
MDGPLSTVTEGVTSGGCPLSNLEPWALLVLGSVALMARVPGAGAQALTCMVGAAALAGTDRSATAAQAKGPPKGRPNGSHHLQGRRESGIALLLGIGAVWLVGRAGLAPRSADLLGVAGTVAAAVGEEAFFRRFLYGWLQPLGGWAAVGVSAAAFALVHLPMYGAASLPLNLGAGLLLGWQRWASGRWSIPAATHAFANLIGIGVIA